MPDRRKHIAIVEDDESVRVALSQLIAAFGFAPTAYDSADAFISDQDGGRFACIITDYQMPAKTGLDLINHLRVNAVDVPVIVMTGRDHRALEGKCNDLKISLLKKPLSASALIAAVEVALSRTG